MTCYYDVFSVHVRFIAIQVTSLSIINEHGRKKRKSRQGSGNGVEKVGEHGEL